jgi:hypothetical protein
MKYSMLLFMFFTTLGVTGQTLQTVTTNGNTTTNSININTGAEALSLTGNSYLSFKDAGNSIRNGYMQHDGSNLLFGSDVGNIRFLNKVAVGIPVPYESSSLHIKSTISSPWTVLAEANSNRRLTSLSHTGNEGVIAVSYLDDSGYSPLHLWTSNITRLAITPDGQVGIGTPSPENIDGWERVLEVKGVAHAKSVVSSSDIQTGLWAHVLGFYGAPAGGITGTSTNHPFSIITNQSTKMTIASNGDVGIGTITPKEKLSVNGKIRAHEIKVETANWPDYVFAKGYQLPSLDDTEKHIKEKGHLPGIPSAEEVKNNGIDLGDMNAKLLQKIEELTLQLIEVNKEVKLLKLQVKK